MKFVEGNFIRNIINGKYGIIQSIPNEYTIWVRHEEDAPMIEIGYPPSELEIITFGEYGGYYEKKQNKGLLSKVNTESKPIKTDFEIARKRGAGGAPTRATILPDDPKQRKQYPVSSGVLDYFPDALVAISEVSQAGNDQHNPGMPLQWTRSKSGDEADTCIRHFLQRGTKDVDGKRHTAKAAWRMLALLQKEIESEQDASSK